MKKQKTKNPKPSEKSKNILADLVWDNSNAGKKNIPSAAKNIRAVDKNIPTKRSKAKVVKPSPSKKFTHVLVGKNKMGRSRGVKRHEKTDIRPLAEFLSRLFVYVLFASLANDKNKGKKKEAKNHRKKK